MQYLEEIDLRKLPSMEGKTLKEVMEELEPSKIVTISGGFGYSKEDAIVIEKPNSHRPFDGVGLEAFVAKAKFQMESGVMRYQGDRFRIVDIRMHKQSMVHGEDGKKYDHLEYVVVLAFQKRMAALFEKLQQLPSEEERKNLYEAEIEDCLATVECDIWFEISSFFGLW